jgi:tetratricopeptide (TPR) repeat protein
MHEPATKHKITASFKTCFPDSTLLALLEGSTYQFQFPVVNTLNHYLLVLSVRRAILGETSEAVLQTLLNIARTKQVTLKSTEINEFYYEAWKLAISLKLTTIATTCAHKYIAITSSVTVTKDTEITTRRIELLQYIITIQRETRQERQIIIYLELLATIYITIGETEKATLYYQEIYELNIRIYGRTAPETRRSYQSLTMTVQKSTKTEEIYEITRKDYDEAIHTLSATDEKRISLTWSMIAWYEKQKDTRKLEETLVSLWQSLTRVHTKDVKVQQSKVDIALRYVELLKQQKRTMEAENILRTIWIDLEQDETETNVTRTKVIGEQLQSVGAVDTARSVFSKLWAYYVKTGKQSSTEASSVSTALTQVTRETTSETTYEVTTLVEIFETTIVTATTKTITTTTVKNAVTLVNTYYSQKSWNEVIRVGTITLGKLWPAYNSKDLKAPLPTTYVSETIELITSLAFAYLKIRQIESAETIYRRFFYAVIATSNTSDDLLTSASKTLIEFYQTHTQVEKTIVIYRDLYEEIQKRHGKTNPLAINTLYTLGDISIQLNDIKNAEFAYCEIHTNLAQGTDLAHRDAIRACLTLSTIYEQQRQYSSAQKVYASLWHTFIKHGKDYELQTTFAEDLYHKYVRILKQETKTDYATLHQLAIDYRKGCVRFYGISSEITLKATLQLAEINEENEQHREEAIAMYEEADQKSREVAKGQVSESTLTAIQAARKRLPHLYSISKLSTSRRAITLYSEEWQSQTSNPKAGHAHRDALSWLSLLAIAHAKQGNKESTSKATQAVGLSVFEILKKEKSSQRLASSGSKIADIYLKSGLKSDAQQLLVQLRNQAVFGDSTLSKSLGLASGVKLDPLTWVFIITLGVTLADRKVAGRTEVFSSAMADLITEFFMYEEYQRSVSQKAPFLTTLVYGSRLLQFTKDIHDVAGTARVQTELLGYFATNLSAPKTINQTVLAEFLQLVIVEIHTLEPDVSVLKTSTQAVNAYLDKATFQEAHDLSYLADRFQQFQGGYDSLVKIDLGLQLALVLAGRGKPKSPDPKIRATLFTLSTSITKQIIGTIRSANLNVTEVSISQLNDVSGLLGDQQNLDDLEVSTHNPAVLTNMLTINPQWILTTLWQARDTQSSWSSSTVVGIGRRLVETQFSHGHQDLAIQLCEDICYNLRRVWGALDATTLEMHVLLSSFYTATGNYRRALLVHEDVLRDTVGDKGDELPLAEASQIAVQHLELLKRAYQRLGGWDKEPQVYVDLYQQVAHVFGSEEGWKKAPPASVEKWVPKGADSLGIWTRPASFEFIGAGRKHANYLRKSSGSWALLGNGHSPRLNRAYSSQSIATA